MLRADLYLDQVDLCRYWPVDAAISCQDFLAQVRAGNASIEDFTFLTPQQKRNFKLFLEAEQYLPSVALATAPQPMDGCLFSMNEPDENDTLRHSSALL